MMFMVAVDVMPKSGISDPQGQTIERALPGLGFPGISEVRVGKRITFQIEADSESAAIDTVKKSCEKFLTNPIIEDFVVHVMQAEGAS